MNKSTAGTSPSVFSKRNLLRRVMLSIALGATVTAIAQQPVTQKVDTSAINTQAAQVLPVVDIESN